MSRSHFLEDLCGQEDMRKGVVMQSLTVEIRIAEIYACSTKFFLPWICGNFKFPRNMTAEVFELFLMSVLSGLGKNQSTPTG